VGLNPKALPSAPWSTFVNPTSTNATNTTNSSTTSTTTATTASAKSNSNNGEIMHPAFGIFSLLAISLFVF
jgi:hypothetical protein